MANGFAPPAPRTAGPAYWLRRRRRAPKGYGRSSAADTPVHLRAQPVGCTATGLQFDAGSAYVPDMGQFAVTERAAARIAEILAAEGDAQALRVSVLAGG